MGSLSELLSDGRLRRHAALGTALAAVGLAGFWSVTTAGQDLARRILERHGASKDEAEPKAQFAYGVVETTGGGLGLLAFAPLSVRVGRRGAFALMHLGALAVVPIACYLPGTYRQLLLILPLFGFLTLGMHAGYAIYFPELFPTRLRASGAGFCFNVGRVLAAPVLFLSAYLKTRPDADLRLVISSLALVYLLGLVCILFLPETRGQPLPE